jgi:hypothetical protein
VEAVLFGALAVLAAPACGSSDNDDDDERTVAEALRAYFDDAGLGYAGDCATTTVDEDVGRHCTILRDDRGRSRVYAAGPTFSELDRWLLLEEGDDGWSVVADASAGTLDEPLDPPWEP